MVHFRLSAQDLHKYPNEERVGMKVLFGQIPGLPKPLGSIKDIRLLLEQSMVCWTQIKENKLIMIASPTPLLRNYRTLVEGENSRQSLYERNTRSTTL